LNGFPDAKKVFLSGSFNGWKESELQMEKTAGGWTLPYVIGPGNHQYRFIVDGKWMTDPDNPLATDRKNGNSILIVSPNYTFRLKGRAAAKTVYLSGDFNDWSPTAFPMTRKGDEWVFPLHLPPGKVRYKFVVDGNWILDPNNKLWEQNEYQTGNSVLWIGQ
jgi:1,4-alpha-glucan branching enzyme